MNVNFSEIPLIGRQNFSTFHSVTFIRFIWITGLCTVVAFASHIISQTNRQTHIVHIRTIIFWWPRPYAKNMGRCSLEDIDDSQTLSKHNMSQIAKKNRWNTEREAVILYVESSWRCILRYLILSCADCVQFRVRRHSCYAAPTCVRCVLVQSCSSKYHRLQTLNKTKNLCSECTHRNWRCLLWVNPANISICHSCNWRNQNGRILHSSMRRWESSLKSFPQRGKQFVRTQTRCVRNFVCQTPSLALAKLIWEISNGHDRWWHKHKYTQVIRDFIIVGLRFVSSSSSSVCTNYKTLTQSRLASIEIKRENGNQLVHSTRINSS